MTPLQKCYTSYVASIPKRERGTTDAPERERERRESCSEAVESWRELQRGTAEAPE